MTYVWVPHNSNSEKRGSMEFDRTCHIYNIQTNENKRFIGDSHDWQKEVFLDEYFDSKDFVLSKNNMWLRRRDSYFWSLKIIKNEKDGSSIEIINDPLQIIEILELEFNLECTGESFSTAADALPQTHQKLLKYVPIKIASIPTSRWILKQPGQSQYFCLDSCYMGNNCFYNIIIHSIMGSVDSSCEIINEICKNFAIVQGPSHGKVVEYIHKNNFSMYSKLVQNAIVSKIDHNRASPHCMFPPTNLPPNEMENVARYAVERQLTFASAAFSLFGPQYENDDSDDDNFLEGGE